MELGIWLAITGWTWYYQWHFTYVQTNKCSSMMVDRTTLIQYKRNQEVGEELPFAKWMLVTLLPMVIDISPCCPSHLEALIILGLQSSELVVPDLEASFQTSVTVLPFLLHCMKRGLSIKSSWRQYITCTMHYWLQNSHHHSKTVVQWDRVTDNSSLQTDSRQCASE